MSLTLSLVTLLVSLGIFNNSVFAQTISVPAWNAKKKTSTVTITDISATSWNLPSGFVKFVKVECWGAGGGSAGRSDGGSHGGGGGGAYSAKNNFVLPGPSIPLSIGEGGSSSNNESGRDGGDCFFYDSSFLLAKGGKGALTGYGYFGGAGGLSSEGRGDLKYSGGTGGDAVNGFGGGGGGGAGFPTGNGNARGNSSNSYGGSGGANAGGSAAGGGYGDGVYPGSNGIGGYSNLNGGGGGGGGGRGDSTYASPGIGGAGGIPGGGAGANGRHSHNGGTPG